MDRCWKYFNILTQLMRLQQIACGHFTADDGATQPITNNRITELMSVLEETEGKAIIWANYIHDIEHITKAIKKKYGDFEGKNFETSWGRVFGGQVLAQSLHAAYKTVPQDRFAHSLHGYFILGGNLDLPITYEVDIIRDGKSFTTRRVVAFQQGRGKDCDSRPSGGTSHWPGRTRKGAWAQHGVSRPSRE